MCWNEDIVTVIINKHCNKKAYRKLFLDISMAEKIKYNNYKQ